MRPETGSNPQRWDDGWFRALKISDLYHSATGQPEVSLKILFMTLYKNIKLEWIFPTRVSTVKPINFIWAISWQNQQSDCAPSENSDQPGHPPNLIRVFAVRWKKAWVLGYPLSAQRRLWSDWADAQADLSPRWAHMPFCLFYHDAAHFAVHHLRVGESRAGCNTFSY